MPLLSSDIKTVANSNSAELPSDLFGIKNWCRNAPVNHVQCFLASWVESYYCISCKERIYTPDIRTPIFYFLLHQNHQSFATEEMMHFSQKFGEREKLPPKIYGYRVIIYHRKCLCASSLLDWTGRCCFFTKKLGHIWAETNWFGKEKYTHISAPPDQNLTGRH